MVAATTQLRAKEVHLPNLYAHGLDPTTNVGMSNLTRLRRRAVEEWEGVDDVVVIVSVAGWCYAFGADARIVFRAIPIITVEMVGDLSPGIGAWIGFRAESLPAVVSAIEFRRLPVEVVNHAGRRLTATVEDFAVAEGGAA